MFTRSIYVFLILLFLLAPGCKREIQKHFHITIVSPEEGTIFYPGEDVRILARVPMDAGLVHFEVLLNDRPFFESEGKNLDTRLKKPFNSEGMHEIKVRAFNPEGLATETAVKVTVVSPANETSSRESFRESVEDTWFLSNWTRNTTQGYDDNSSLLSTDNRACAITRKHFSGPGSVSFYVKNGADGLEFHLDGMIKAKWFVKEDWGCYVYTVPEGDHVFKWISHSESTCIDLVEFNLGEELHTPGEYFGGGIVYHVDSTGLHGLITTYEDAAIDGSSAIPWGCWGVEINSGNWAESPVNGIANTLAIINVCKESKISARYCYELSVTDDTVVYDDWYLPAIVELDHLHTNRAIFDNLFGQYYWSSSVKSLGQAHVIDFRDGSHHGAQRNIPNVMGPVTARIFTRPVRRF